MHKVHTKDSSREPHRLMVCEDINALLLFIGYQIAPLRSDTEKFHLFAFIGVWCNWQHNRFWFCNWGIVLLHPNNGDVVKLVETH